MYNLIFLGDRKIAQNAMALLTSDKYKAFFNIRVLVASQQFYEKTKEYYRIAPEVFISNEKRNDNAIKEAIISARCDLLLSVQHNWILSENILQSVNFKAFNLHNAKLPNYKGYNSISHAIYNGDSEYVSTIHWMVPHVDSGDIAYESTIIIKDDETALSLYKKTVEGATSILNTLLSDLSIGKEPPRRPIAGEGVFYKKEDLNEMKTITEKMSFQEIEKRARAVYFPPHMPACISFGKSKIFLIPESEQSKEISLLNAAYACEW